ncbi:MAG: DUF6132 family protein [Bacteroidota bacterium]|nr:DUF6132 family protein [Bacteroidota bacterium]
MNFFNKNKLALIGVLAGAIGGYFYYHFVGCSSGTCPITSKPINSTLYGAMMGGLLFSLFKKEKNNIEKNKNSDQ